jgi:hypothetical protein
MKKTAVIDIDNTLWQFCDAFYLELIKINRDFPTPDRWSSSGFWTEYCSESDFMNSINFIHYNQESEAYRPYPEAKTFLSTLMKEGFHIILASHRLTDTMQPTENWLKKHELPYDEIHLSSDKTILFNRTDVVVDDIPHTLKKAVECGALGTGLLFPWNQAYAGKGFGLFQNLNDVLDYILENIELKPVTVQA